MNIGYIAHSWVCPVCRNSSKYEPANEDICDYCVDEQYTSSGQQARNLFADSMDAFESGRDVDLRGFVMRDFTDKKHRRL